MKKFIIGLYFIFMQSAYATTPCQSSEHKAFDFWLGNWQVTSDADDVKRLNKITKINHGCTILEEYSTPSGYVGKSLNIYDQQTQQWHQTWTDSAGLLLQLSGNIIEGSMVMRGTTISATKQEILNRITWTPNKNGSVRQHWQVSDDHGKHWQTLFDGYYQKVTP